MRKVLRKPMQKISKLVIVGALGITCLQMTSFVIRADDSMLKDEATIKKALEIYFDEPVSQGTLIPGREGGFGTNEEDNRWQQLSLPIGNSMMGANVYGEIGKERLTFNQKTLWNGGPSEKRPNYDGGNVDNVGNMSMADYVKGVQDKFLNGVDASDDCNEIRGEQDGYGAYQSFGDIYLDFNLKGNATNYRRALNLNNALASVDFTLDGTDYHREFFASYPDNVIAMKVTAKGNEKLNFNVTFPIDNMFDENPDKVEELVATLGKTVQTVAKNDTITVKGYMNDNQMKLNGKLKVVTNEGTIRENGESLGVSNASEAIIFVSAGTDYKNEYPKYRTGESDLELDTRVMKVVNEAVTKGYEKVKADAIGDYTEIFDRVSLNLGQDIPNLATDQLLTQYNNGTANDAQRRAIETLLFQYGRYLQIASSRQGDLPANLQGVWNNRVGSAGRVPWGSDYHMNVNLQMNYWPTYNTNMAECADPLIDYIDSLREPGRVTAETYFGVASDDDNPANGFTAHTQNTPFGWTCPGWAFSWGWSPAAVPWILQNCYEQFEYTGDLAYLRENIYPMLKEEAILYQQILREDPTTGRMVTVPAYSPEHGPRTAGNAYEQSLVWQLFKDSIEAATALGVDDKLVTEWKALQAKLQPIEIGDDGQIKEWYNETTFGSIADTDRKHRHMSHLLGLFPGDLISVDNQEYLDAARVSLDDRGDDATGWGMGQRLNTWARLGDGNHAYSIIGAFFKGGAYPNLWDAHAPFQIDGNFGYTAGVAEMLLQSNMGYVNLLPALPDTWTEGSVSGLVARGNFEVSMDWSKTNLTSASLLSKNGGECTIQYTNIKDAIIKHDGSVVQVKTLNDDRVSFDTEKGGIYTIEKIPAKPLKAPETANAYTDGKQVLIDFNAVVNAKAYAVYSSTDGVNYTKLGNTNTSPYTVNDYQVGNSYYLASIGEDDKEGDKGTAIEPQNISAISKMDDRDSMIQYSTGWGNWDDADQYMGTEKYTENTGSSLEFYFSGTGLRVIGMKASNTHTYDLYIDDQLVDAGVDTNSSSTMRQQVFSEITGLEDGVHKVRLYVSKAKVSLDAFEIIRDVKPTGITIKSDTDKVNLNITKTLPLSATYLPEGAGAPKNVEWSVENDLGLPSGIATIDAEGLVTFKAVGTVIVKALDVDNELKAEKVIVVTKDSELVKVDDRSETIKYSSDWSTWDESKHEFGTITETTTKGASFEFDFTGKNIALYFMKLEASAINAGADIEVFIDGKSFGEHSTFTTVTGSEPKQKVFETKGLEDTKHTLKIVVGDVSKEAPEGRTPKVAFDYYATVTDAEAALDYSALKEEIITHRDMDLSIYTEATKAAYIEAYKTATALYELASDQNAIDSAKALLVAKREALKTIENTDTLKEKLADIMEKAETAIENGQVIVLDVSMQKALHDAMASAKAIIADEESTSEAIKGVYSSIEVILNDINYDVDKTALQKLITKCAELNADDYGLGVQAFKEALSEATLINANKKATQVEVDAVMQKLSLAKDELKVDKANLTLAIDQATRVLNDADAYQKDDNWMAFIDALDKAEKILVSSSATQGQTDAALQALKVTQDALQKYDVKELLNNLIQEAEDVKDNANYTEASLAALNEAITLAKAVMVNDAATDEEVKAAHDALQKAINELATAVDKSALSAIIKEADRLDLSHYTGESVKKFSLVLNEAKAVMENKAATQAEVDASVKAIEMAMDALEKNVSNTGSANKPGGANTGDSTNKLAWLGIMAVSMLVLGTHKKRKIQD